MPTPAAQGSGTEKWLGVLKSAPEGSKILSLAYCGITELWIEPLLPFRRTLTHLDLSHNDIKNIPEDIEKLDHLQVLVLSHNALTTIPRSLTKLPCLEVLGLASNSLTAKFLDEYPWKEVKFLSTLYLNSNGLSQISASLTQIPSLQTLSLTDNRITMIPDLSGLPNLECIALSGNPLNLEGAQNLVTAPSLKAVSISCSAMTGSDEILLVSQIRAAAPQISLNRIGTTNMLKYQQAAEDGRVLALHSVPNPPKCKDPSIINRLPERDVPQVSIMLPPVTIITTQPHSGIPEAPVDTVSIGGSMQSIGQVSTVGSSISLNATATNAASDMSLTTGPQPRVPSSTNSLVPPSTSSRASIYVTTSPSIIGFTDSTSMSAPLSAPLEKIAGLKSKLELGSHDSLASKAISENLSWLNLYYDASDNMEILDTAPAPPPPLKPSSGDTPTFPPEPETAIPEVIPNLGPSPSSGKSSFTCPVCKQAITGGSYFSALNSAIHDRCFKCTVCGEKLLPDKFYRLKNQLVSERMQLYDEKCFTKLTHPQ